MGKTNEKLLPSCKGAKLMEGKVLKEKVNVDEVATWVEELNV